MEDLLKKRKETLWIRNSIIFGLIVLECMLYQWKVNFLAVYSIGFSIVGVVVCIWAANGLLYIDQLVFNDLKSFLKQKVELQKEFGILSICIVDHWVDEYKRQYIKYPFILNLLMDKEESKPYQEVLQSIVWSSKDFQKSLWQIINLEYSKIARSIEQQKDDAYFYLQHLSLDDVSNVLQYVDHLVVDCHMLCTLKHRKDEGMIRFFDLCIEKEISLIPDLTKEHLFRFELPFEILGYLVKYESEKLNAIMSIKFQNLRQEVLDLWLKLPEKEWSLFKYWKADLSVFSIEFTQEEIDDYGRYIRSL